MGVAWSTPPPIHINGLLTQYRVQYNPVQSSDSITQLNVSHITLSKDIGFLANFTCYVVSVSAYTRVGEGPVAMVTGWTDENGMSLYTSYTDTCKQSK